MKRRYMDLMHLGFNEVAAKAAGEAPPVTMEQIAARLGVSVEELYRAVGSEQPKEQS